MPDSPLADALRDVVRKHLAERGQSVASLARDTGLGQPTLSRQLRGAGVITVDEWDAIARALGWMDLEEMLDTARRRM